MSFFLCDLLFCWRWVYKLHKRLDDWVGLILMEYDVGVVICNSFSAYMIFSPLFQRTFLSEQSHQITSVEVKCDQVKVPSNAERNPLGNPHKFFILKLVYILPSWHVFHMLFSGPNLPLSVRKIHTSHHQISYLFGIKLACDESKKVMTPAGFRNDPKWAKMAQNWSQDEFFCPFSWDSAWTPISRYRSPWIASLLIPSMLRTTMLR